MKSYKSYQDLKYSEYPENMMTSSNGNIYWSFVRGIHRSTVNYPHKGQWRVALMSSLIRTWTNSWANNGDAGDLRRHRAHHDIIVMNSYFFAFMVVWYRSILTIPFGVTSLALGQSYGCPCACEVTLQNIRKWITRTYFERMASINTTSMDKKSTRVLMT